MEANHDKRKRYDRQLRMWGEQGQEALERCKLCLVNGSATGTETLKNLVLPGIGSFTVVDDAVVTTRDLGNNFFVEEAHLGRPRAECVTALLQELNEHVRGSFVCDSITSLLESDPSFLHEFTIVVATQLPQHTLRKLALACSEQSLPLVVLRSYGLVGLVRIAAGEHVVTEDHADNAPSDLRVAAPFPELLAYAATHFADPESMSIVERKHIPYAVLLLIVLKQYKDAHGGALPTTYKEKQEIKALLTSLSERWFGVEGAMDAINFDEAKLAVNTAVAPPSLPSSTREVLAEAEKRIQGFKPPNDGSASPTHADKQTNRPFWILAAALSRFVAKEGGAHLPVIGTLPDMTADTASYVKLSAIYRERAIKDAAKVHAHVQAILVSLGHPESYISLEQTRAFCKNAHGAQWVRFRSIEEECTPEAAQVKELAAMLDDGSQAPAAGFYLLLRAADAFYSQYNRWPGGMDNDIESDVPVLKQCVTQLVSELKAHSGAPLVVSDELVFEICRYGAAELHSVASIVGGVGAQEVIKLLTGQFVPLNNTFIYNGLDGTSVSAEL
mmetsp:Transcript_7775/g.21258  ORF Transcript_7775/g.21258 Transcript_7775/m.21258 type:complete len:558 (-) Transcript_7775:176-1849(-)